MFKINILNISLWVLISILIFLLIIVIFLRKFYPHLLSNVNNNKNNNNNIGAISNDMKQMVLSLSSIYDFNIGYNILFKNRFSKIGHSFIPIIIVHGNQVFILTNRIKHKKNSSIVVEDNNIFYKQKNNKLFLLENINLYKEIERYISSVIPKIKIEIIVPIIGDLNSIKNDSNIKMLSSIDIGEYIEGYKTLNSPEILKLWKKLNSNNIFKKSGSIYDAKTLRLKK